MFLENYYRTLFVGTQPAPRASRSARCCSTAWSWRSCIAVGKIAISILSAYAVVYFRFPFRMAAFWLIFVTLMLPVEVRIIPTYKVVSDLGLLDTYAGPDRPADRLGDRDLPVPPVLPDHPRRAGRGRASIDGAGPMRFFMERVLPLSRTNIAALFVILFIYGWNQYLWPLLITTRDDM